MNAPARIGCPRTGRTWPAHRSRYLKSCTACSGVIDTWTEAWRDADGPAAHVTCPPPLAGARPTEPGAELVKLKGADLLAEWERRRDLVHEQALRDVQAAQLAAVNGTGT